MICQVCETKQTTLCSWSISHDVICIPRPASYVIRNQPHDVVHMETERPRVKNSRCRHISWMKVFIVGLINHVWYALEMIPGTAWYVIRKTVTPPCFVLGQGQSMLRPKWSIRKEEPSIAITEDLRPFLTHTGLTENTALFQLVIVTHHPWRVLASISMQNVDWPTRRPPFFISPNTVPPRTSAIQQQSCSSQ